MMNQRQGVFAAVIAVLGLGSNFKGKVELNKDQRKQVHELVADGLFSGEIAFSDDAKAKYSTREAIVKQYVPGLVNNWLRKDTNLNGGDKYVTKNPGSRAGSGDEVMKNLKALRSTLTDPEHIAAVDAEIANRTAEIAASKAKTTVIDPTKIPESLRSLIKAS